jgi:hypothetical protein
VTVAMWSAGHVQEPWSAVIEGRERPHHGLVLAIAVAARQAERPSAFYVAVIPRDPPVPGFRLD